MPRAARPTRTTGSALRRALLRALALACLVLAAAVTVRLPLATLVQLAALSLTGLGLAR